MIGAIAVGTILMCGFVAIPIWLVWHVFSWSAFRTLCWLSAAGMVAAAFEMERLAGDKIGRALCWVSVFVWLELVAAMLIWVPVGSLAAPFLLTFIALLPPLGWAAELVLRNLLLAALIRKARQLGRSHQFRLAAWIVLAILAGSAFHIEGRDRREARAAHIPAALYALSQIGFTRPRDTQCSIRFGSVSGCFSWFEKPASQAPCTVELRGRGFRIDVDLSGRYLRERRLIRGECQSAIRRVESVAEARKAMNACPGFGRFDWSAWTYSPPTPTQENSEDYQFERQAKSGISSSSITVSPAGEVEIHIRDGAGFTVGR